MIKNITNETNIAMILNSVSQMVFLIIREKTQRYLKTDASTVTMVLWVSSGSIAYSESGCWTSEEWERSSSEL